jgi:glutathione reductase (NADPH)
VVTRRFDLVVIGSGAAGSTIATRCRTAGWTVAVVDKRPFGGTCALRGCDPKKVLVGAAAALDTARAFDGKGVSPNGLALNWPDLMRFKRTFTDPVPRRRMDALHSAGIETFQDVARFTGPAQLSVGGVALEATRAIAIAAGAMPAHLEVEGREHLLTSDDFLELPSLPSSIAFVGGGYVAFEFAHIAARAGAHVTIIHRGERPLEQFDADLVKQLVERTRAAGIELRFRAEVRAITGAGRGYRVQFDGAGGGEIDADCVVHAAGRVPDLDDLQLDVGRVERSRDGVRVNEFLQSVSNPTVYAAGDCAATGRPRLTPVAGYEGRIVAANMLEGTNTAVDYHAIPSVVFTIPPLARVGLGEDEARGQRLRFTTRYKDTSTWYSSRRVAERASGFKLLIEQDSHRLLGAHLLGPHAEETINVFALAIRTGVTADRLKQMIWAYPTHASDIAYMLP